MAISLLSEDLTTGKVVTVVLISCVAALIFGALSEPAYPQFSWVGEGKGLWPWLKGNITYLFHYADWVQDGYRKVFFCCQTAARTPIDTCNDSMRKRTRHSSFKATQCSIVKLCCLVPKPPGCSTSLIMSSPRLRHRARHYMGNITS